MERKGKNDKKLNISRTKKLFRWNKKNDKQFQQSHLFMIFLNGHLSEHLWLIPNILKWRNCKIFTKLVPSQNPSRSNHQRCSVKKIFLKIYEISLENICVGDGFKLSLKETPTKVFSSEIYEIFNNTYFEEYLSRLLLTKLNHNINLWLSWRHRFLYNIINC